MNLVAQPSRSFLASTATNQANTLARIVLLLTREVDRFGSRSRQWKHLDLLLLNRWQGRPTLKQYLHQPKIRLFRDRSCFSQTASCRAQQRLFMSHDQNGVRKYDLGGFVGVASCDYFLCSFRVPWSFVNLSEANLVDVPVDCFVRAA